jgi:hypothetical protein
MVMVTIIMVMVTIIILMVILKDYFDRLVKEDLFSKDSIPDQVSLLAIYMPILRAHIHAFVDVWNIHPIRPQPRRPYAVTGKPVMNYYSAERAVDQASANTADQIADQIATDQIAANQIAANQIAADQIAAD